MSNDEHRPAVPDDAEQEGFLRRWSRRKQEANRVTIPEQAAMQPVAGMPEISEPAGETPVPTAPDAAATDTDREDIEPPGDDDMPPLDSLGPDSDISPFFSPRVSESLRNLVLQRLFQQPEFNVTDGLDVYCEDFRHYTPLGDVMTSDLRLQMNRARQRLSQLLADARNTDETAAAVQPTHSETLAPAAETAPAEQFFGEDDEHDGDV